ncbi:hypothetical protein LCGC14_1579170 [marine sediment metagenome]|uniref:Yeast cell wall synthesis Kre9/Knh1-like N-terminal domain-containing protein n=1 Tax=marine sediment metagenome TaxID=412755 RepID=A0A0F9J3I5_9ZZZZ
MGNYYDIKFENSEYVHEINVSLYHNDEFVYYIETQRNNWGYWYEGHCPWVIPYGLTPSTNYSIVIFDYENSNTKGVSDYFEITEHRGFNIINPIETTKIKPNSQYVINWSSTGQVDNVRIELWRDMHYEDGLLISMDIIIIISVSTPNDGSFIWDVPDLPTGYDYFIELASTTDSGCWARSDEFYIGPFNSNDMAIPGYNIFIFLGSILLMSIVIITRKKKSRLHIVSI